VTLCEKEEVLGGQLLLAGLPPGRDEFQVLARDLEAQLAAAGVAEVRMGVTVDEAFLDRERPDAVILATGAEEWAPPLDGADLPHVVGAWDVLRDRVQTGPRVVIIGGGAVGVETALFLAEKGTLSGDMVRFLLINRAEPLEDLYDLATRGVKDVTLVEMLDRIGPDIGRSTRWGMLQDLERHHVKTLAKTRARAITPTTVVVEDATGTREIPADSVVLALGSRSRNPLEVPVRGRGLPYQIIGDARKVAKAMDAIHEGFEAGARL
jgi:2,4-dienoyl-CoA reductase (NADPH2)